MGTRLKLADGRGPECSDPASRISPVLTTRAGQAAQLPPAPRYTAAMVKRKAHNIYVGVGGWNFAPWRETFYPKGTTQSRELEYASSQLTSIEINSTFYGLQKPSTFKKWHDATPDGF